MMVFTCLTRARVCILPSEEINYPNVITYAQLGSNRIGEYTCKMDISDLSILSGGTDMRVMTVLSRERGKEVVDASNDTDYAVNQSYCENLESLNSLSVYTSTDVDIERFLNCYSVYREMAEVEFVNLSWSELPSTFPHKFPNLQSLNIRNNNFTTPPTLFPWTDEVNRLPHNLSRSEYMDNQYTKINLIDIPRNEFRRVFDISYNRIQNLSGYMFHGYLQMINLAGNAMFQIDEKAFGSVTGLQNIDLSFNLLREIHEHLFVGMLELHKLDIGNNRIAELETEVFKDLITLKILNLENNLLSFLPQGIFATLTQLEKLYLGNNKLSVLREDMMPKGWNSLKETYVNDNPIQSLPVFVFWMNDLTFADFQNTSIGSINMTDISLKVNIQRFTDAVRKRLSLRNRLREIDLSNCEIETIIFAENYTATMQNILITLLHHFRLTMTDNPLVCDCNVRFNGNFLRNLKRNRAVSADAYYFREWICESPVQLQGKPLLGVEDENLYCEVNLTDCPTECKCFWRPYNNNIIIDCRNLNLKTIHESMPNGALELLYEGNNITNIYSQTVLERAVILDVSHNRLTKIENQVFINTRSLQVLRLNFNQLSYLPNTLAQLKQLRSVTLFDNVFLCDCQSLWLKRWIWENQMTISHWNKVTCSSLDDEKIIVNVKDSAFICDGDRETKYLLSSLISSACLLFAAVVSPILYLFRMEIKVLLYIKFGIHPCDKCHEEANETIDCLVIHSKHGTD